jgi:Notch-like protein
LLNIDRKLNDNHLTIADSLNNYFLTIDDKINTNNLNVNNTLESGTNNYLNYLSQTFTTAFTKIKFNHTSTKEVENIIKSLKPKNSHGYDEISVKLLKISSPFICSPLTYTCNKSLSSGIFPTGSKYSEIKPLFKNGDRTNMTNYRSISLLTSFSKFFEKVIYAALHQHIMSSNILLN